MAEARGSIFSMSWRGALRHKMGSEASDDMSAEFHELNNGLKHTRKFMEEAESTVEKFVAATHAYHSELMEFQSALQTMLETKASPPFSDAFVAGVRSCHGAIDTAFQQMVRRLAASFMDAVQVRLAAEMKHCKDIKMRAYAALQERNSKAARVKELTKSKKFSDQTRLVEAQSAHRAAVASFGEQQDSVIAAMNATQEDACLSTAELVSHTLMCQLTAFATSAASLRHLFEQLEGEVAHLRVRRKAWWQEGSAAAGVAELAPPGVLTSAAGGVSGVSGMAGSHASVAIPPGPAHGSPMIMARSSSVGVEAGMGEELDAALGGAVEPVDPPSVPTPGLVPPDIAAVTRTLLPPAPLPPLFGETVGLVVPRVVETTSGRLGTLVVSNYRLRFFPWRRLPWEGAGEEGAGPTPPGPRLARTSSTSDLAVDVTGAPPVASLPGGGHGEGPSPPGMTLVVSTPALASVTSIPLRCIAQLEVSSSATAVVRGRDPSAPPGSVLPSPTQDASVLAVWCTDLTTAVFNFVHAEVQGPPLGGGGAQASGHSDREFAVAVADWAAWAATVLPGDLVHRYGLVGGGDAAGPTGTSTTSAGRAVSGRFSLLGLPSTNVAAQVRQALEAHVWEDAPVFATQHRLRPAAVELPLQLAQLPLPLLRAVVPCIPTLWATLPGGADGADGSAKRLAVLRHLGGLWSVDSGSGLGDVDGWTLLDLGYELSRMRDGEAHWRVSDINAGHGLAPTYPARVIAPASVDDETLAGAAKYRSKSRLPAVVWAFGRVSLSRASQPMSGVFGSTNRQDETLLSALAAHPAGEGGGWTPPVAPLSYPGGPGGEWTSVTTPRGSARVHVAASTPLTRVSLAPFTQLQWAYVGYDFSAPARSSAVVLPGGESEEEGGAGEGSGGGGPGAGTAAPSSPDASPPARKATGSIFDSLKRSTSGRSSPSAAEAASQLQAGPSRRASISARPVSRASLGGGHSVSGPIELGKAPGQGVSLAILDARPRMNALGNMGKGGGSESAARYGGADLTFLGIDNIHVVRDALAGLRGALLAAASAALHGAARVAKAGVAWSAGGGGGEGGGGHAPSLPPPSPSTASVRVLPSFLRPRSVTTDSLGDEMRRALVQAGMVPRSTLGRSTRALASSGIFESAPEVGAALDAGTDAGLAELAAGAQGAEGGRGVSVGGGVPEAPAAFSLSFGRHAHFPLVRFTPPTGGMSGLMPVPSPLAPPLPPHVADVITGVPNAPRLPWLKLLSTVLVGSVRVARCLAEGASVFVHCSDGWDRTAQLTALAQLLLDPYYRTMGGFAVLVEKEWCSFGHQFAMRTGGGCGNAREKHGHKKRSPVFLQFLDAVWQVARQFPTAFEFNCAFLACMATHAYSGRFGTFLHDHEGGRQAVRGGAESLWSHMARRALEFRNPWYMLPDTPPTRGYLAALWDASPATAALVDPQGLGKGAPAQSPEAAGAGGGGGRASVGRLARMSRVRAASAEQLPAVEPAEPSTLGALPMDVFNACAAATCGIMASVPTSPGQFALWPATRPEALVVWPLWAMKYCAAVDYPTEDVVALPVPGTPTESPVQQAVPAALPSAVPQRLVRPARVNSSGERPPPLPDRSRKHSVSSTPSRPPPRRSMESTTLPEARAGVGSELPQPPAAPHSSPPGCSWLVVPALNREREQAAMGTEGGEFVVEVSLVLPIGIQFAVRVLAVLRHSAIVGMHETVERRRRPAQGLW